ncbi:unnamed protein product [Eruca vesicaria subsp. sativa]|uniref:Glycine-rich protein n=1 Tax=Eruca vesicaria subsp. sativa TaxID=29727 RepID=A0ABC8JK52_ERUVS|nr:unnamed protein product [Eruca vesicaria subsp. sativa]
MDHKSSTIAEAVPVVIEATTHREEASREPKDDVEKHRNDEKISDVMEILLGLSGRLQKMEEKMECRFQEMEEKMDLLFSSKVEAENMSIDDESSFRQESDESGNRFVRFSDDRDRRSYERSHRFFGPGHGQQTYDRSGCCQETDHDSFSRFFNGYGQYGDDRFDRFFNRRGRGRGLHVGGRFAGGRCGGQGFCGGC